MRRIVLAAAVMVIAANAVRPHAASTTPVLVELFTSEGCESCPPADDLLARIVAAQPIEGARVIALGEHVDYWDQLGWKDRFSSAAFTNRQQVYTGQLRNDGPYTPQLVVDGRLECVGSDASAARKLIATAATAAHGTASMSWNGATATVAVEALPQKATDRADILLAITEDRLVSKVTRGENRGRTLTHVAVVRQLMTIGEAIGASATAERPVTLAPDWNRDHLNFVAFVQQRRNGPVLASATISLAQHP
ncbi:MAG TPA: DUF1223 domain-containing protein [Vicinamibacterales bacterium]|nr:DUF1223 domain-containing protein [Vicinamibacterales bacterium]